MSDRIWISWYYQRRSGELSRAFSADYRYFSDIFTSRLRRYLLCLPKTYQLISASRPKVLFVQNPSILLAVFAAVMKPFFRYALVNDLHTPYLKVSPAVGRLFWGVQRFCVAHADVTLVTNERMRRLLGERPSIRVLPDPLPAVAHGVRVALPGKRNVLYVSSFAVDEPYREVIRAASLIAPEICIHVTGRYEKAGLRADDMPANVRLTGYLSDEEYQALLLSADVVLVLTDQEGCLVCGAYEGVAAGKPLVLSATEALTGYFSRGVVFVENDAASIAAGIMKAVSAADALAADVARLAVELERDWREKFDAVERLLEER